MTVAHAVGENTAAEAAAEIHELMIGLGKAARAAARALARAKSETKNAALVAAAEAVREDRAVLLDANRRDLDDAHGLSATLRDRLALNEGRIEGMAKGLEDIAALPDPVGEVMAEWTRPNGLSIARVRTPLGVVGIIYESRPNVTADAGGLCLKSANAAILRGGSESLHSSIVIHACLERGLVAAGLPAASIQLVPTRERAAVGEMLAMSDYIDIIVPRGGQSLIERVQSESRIPVIAHLIGNCHVYVHEGADIELARKIVVNAKMRRTGVCGAAESLLVDRAVAPTHLALIVDDLAAAGCEVRGDAAASALDARIVAAGEADWDTEYLDAVISVALVEGLDAAIGHIARHGSSHTESIVTGDQAAADRFLAEVDSAIVMHNASTQFADGGEFGMGAEIGISTSKLHARGPVGVEQLTIFKYVVRGSGQTRP